MPADATPAERNSALLVLSRLSERSGVKYTGSAAHIRLIVGRLRDGITEMELRAIVAYCDEEWEGKPQMRGYLRPETLFGPETHQKYLDPARTRYAKELSDQPKLEVVR